MDKKELEQLEEKEQYDVKYMSELRIYWNAFSYALINEIYVGVAINLGISEKEAYKLAKSRPGDMQKASFFKSIFNRFKNIFKHKVPRFRYKKPIWNKEKGMTPKQWEVFNKSVSDYWKKNSGVVSEDIAIKSFLLGKKTTEYREEKKSYKNKSLEQVSSEQYDGDMPDTIVEAYKKYDFKNYEKKIMNRSYNNIAMYVTETDNKIQEAIRQQIQTGIENNKSPVEVASDLYWNVEKNEALVNGETAESMRKDWNRISSTEMATVYEEGILAPYEAEAMESLKDPSKAQYFVRTGGTCEWCLSKRGTIVRLVPTSIVTDVKNESLSAMGFEDPNTDIAIWVGKNNVGLKRNKQVDEWMICCPSHPFNVATFQPIDIGSEEYDQKTDDVILAPKKDQFEFKINFTEKSKEEKKERKPKLISKDKVEMNNNTYVAVEPGEYNKKLEEWRNNPQGSIPINTSSPSYKRIFGAAEKE